jgi:hypothetical protein
LIYLVTIVIGIISVFLGEWLSLIPFFIFSWIYDIIFKAQEPEHRIPGLYISRIISGLSIGIINGLLIYFYKLNGWIFLFIFIVTLIIYLERFNEFEFNLISKGNERHYKRLIILFQWLRFLGYLFGVYGIYYFLTTWYGY